jgi:uncharacterized surface protein with fasciclin (FAS1) repeats
MVQRAPKAIYGRRAENLRGANLGDSAGLSAPVGCSLTPSKNGNPMKRLAGLAVAALTFFTSTGVQAQMKDIVDTAVGAGKFNTLVAAVKAAGLVETLKGAGPFTVFAPTDEAFAKLPKGTVEDLLKPENKAKLAGILTYHVVPGKVMAADISGKKMGVKTVQGSEIQVDAMSGVMINGASVTTADVATSNGVIHIIDTVLLPK